jgi:hypothetical protein
MGADWFPTALNFFTRPPAGTPRRAISPSEGSPRPRVARAQKIISLHPHFFGVRCSGIYRDVGFRGTWLVSMTC